VIQQCSVPEDGASADFTELIKVLQQFVESSSLGEFSERLKILSSFSHQETIDNARNESAGNR
jgi:midasin (ATPase involved in ribosome maturation)